MDLWNRASVSLVALLVLTAAIVTLLVGTDAIDPDFLPRGWFEPQLQDLADYSGSDLVIAIVVVIVVAIGMLAVLALEAKPLGRRGALPISSTEEGALTINADSVRLLAEKTGLSNGNLSSLRCRLRVSRRRPVGGPASIIVECHPKLILGSNVQEVRDDLQTRIKDAVGQLTGLTVMRVNVRGVRYDKGEGPRLIGA